LQKTPKRYRGHSVGPSRFHNNRWLSQDLEDSAKVMRTRSGVMQTQSWSRGARYEISVQFMNTHLGIIQTRSSSVMQAPHDYVGITMGHTGFIHEWACTCSWVCSTDLRLCISAKGLKWV
jgi:hypothetical protein